MFNIKFVHLFFKKKLLCITFFSQPIQFGEKIEFLIFNSIYND